MKNANRQFLLILCVAIVICIIFLIYQLSAAKKISIKYSERPLIETSATEIPIDPMDPIIGNQGAPISIVAFIDFNDSENRRLYQKISAFVKDNPSKLRLIFKDFPNKGLFAEDDIKPHIAAFCAKKQNKFAEYADELAKLSGKTTNSDTLATIAEKIGIKSDTWKPCLTSTEAKTRIESSISLGKSIGLKEAPVLFINNLRVNYIEEINIDDFLKELTKEYIL